MIYYVTFKNQFGLIEADSIGHANKKAYSVFGARNAPFQVRVATEADLNWSALSKIEAQ